MDPTPQPQVELLKYVLKFTDGEATVVFRCVAATREMALAKARLFFGEGWREVKE